MLRSALLLTQGRHSVTERTHSGALRAATPVAGAVQTDVSERFTDVSNSPTGVSERPLMSVSGTLTSTSRRLTSMRDARTTTNGAGQQLTARGWQRTMRGWQRTTRCHQPPQRCDTWRAGNRVAAGGAERRAGACGATCPAGCAPPGGVGSASASRSSCRSCQRLGVAASRSAPVPGQSL